MKIREKITILLGVVLLCTGVLLPAVSYGKIYFQDDFEYSDSLKKHGWESANNIEQMSSKGINNSKCVRVRYDHAGTKGYWFGHNIKSLKLNDIYVRLYFKRTEWVKGGAKFLKIFGKRNDPEGYANTTFALQYASGDLVEVSYGRGVSINNDSQDVIRYNGEKISDPNVKVHTAKRTYKIPGSTWVCFEVHMKYNTNGKRDGEYQVWIDGELWLDAGNIINRHDSNSEFIESVELANYSQPWESIWYLWYDNIVISDKYIGLMDKPTDETVTVDLKENLEQQDNDGEESEEGELELIETSYQSLEVIWLSQGVDLTKHTKGSFTVKIRVDGVDEQGHASIFPRILYYIGTGTSYGYFDMIHEGDNVWKFEIPDPGWYRYRSNSIHYQARVFDEDGGVIAKSRWDIELIDSFIRQN